MTKDEQKKYNALLARVTDIYSGMIGEAIPFDELDDWWIEVDQIPAAIDIFKKLWGDKLPRKLDYNDIVEMSTIRGAVDLIWLLGVRE